MSRRTDKGYGAKRIALNTGDVCVENAKLIATAVDHLLDSDQHNIAALKALNRLTLNNMEVFAIQGLIADGKLAEAEFLSDQHGKKAV